MRAYVDGLWKRAKSPSAIPIGPIQILVSLRRAIKVSSNRKRRRLHARLRDEQDNNRPLDATSQTDSTRDNAAPTSTKVAVVVGADRGFGYSVAERFAQAGYRVALVSRNAERHDPFIRSQRTMNHFMHAYGCDATLESSVAEMFAHVVNDLGAPSFVIYAVQEAAMTDFLNAESSTVDHSWRGNCLGAFHVARDAARSMVARGSGTIVLVGSTSGLIGRARYLNFALGKFGLRAISQVAARELGPKGVHVAHLVIDAAIGESDQPSDEPTMLGSDAAELVYQLHMQPRSCWTQELDARPHDERFWEHC